METAIHDASELESELNPNPVPHVDKLTEHNKPTPAASSPKERLDVMLDKHSDVFENKLGTFTSAKARLTLKDDSQARFLKARPMPYALKSKVEEELRRLQNEGE